MRDTPLFWNILQGIAVKSFSLIHLLSDDFWQGEYPCLQIITTHLDQTKAFYSKFGVAIRVKGAKAQ